MEKTMEENKESKVLLNRRNFLKLGLLSSATIAATTACSKAVEQLNSKPALDGELSKAPLKKYIAKDFSSIKESLVGISPKQLEAHFALYNKYITKINLVEEKISKFNPISGDSDEYRSLQVAQTFMLNGAVLHELYFGNLGTTEKQPGGNFKKMIDRDFGSVENFIGHLKMAGSVMRGWSIAALNYRTGKICVYGLDQHNDLVPTMVYPLLALDVYEHAYMIDYGIDRAKYIDSFVANLNWRPVQDRLELAMSIPFGDLTTA